MGSPLITFQAAADYREALKRASELYGIQPGYWDIWGQWHETSDEVRRAILSSLGVAAGSLEALNAALEARLWREWTQLSPPVVVISESLKSPEMAIRVPLEAEGGRVRVELRCEDGDSAAEEHELRELATKGVAELRGRRFIEKRLPLAPAPPGYHSLRLTILREQDEILRGDTQLIVTPERAYLPRTLANRGKRAGLYVSLYGIRSARSWGCGDFTDLERLAAWVAERVGGSFIGLNPLHAIHNRQPYNTSPYLPLSIYYRNFIYLDVERVAGFAESRWAQALRNSPGIRAEIEELNSAPLVEYERVARLKKVFLRLAFRAFLREWRGQTQRAVEFRRFIEQEGELLERYAVFCALDEWIHRRRPDVWIWPDWPEEYRDPASEATRRFAREHWRSVLFCKFVQWQIDRQLGAAQETARRRGLSIGLLHDLALATDRCGADLWAYRDFFVPDCRVGAPPDDFSPKGQDWSFPPPASERHRADGYRLFRESIRKSCRHGGALRIDHVMRFFRLFWIPAGKEAAHGTYVHDRHEDLVRILALESVRNQVVIVGEDLGTVDPAIRDVLGRFGILSYRLFYFERDNSGQLHPPARYPVQALVSSTTHDLPTLAGFWQNRDIEARRAAGILPDEESYRKALEGRLQEKQNMLDALFRLKLLPEWVPRSADELPELTGELHNAITGFLASTPSMLLALNQEDLTKETEQQNLPGTTSQYPNWRRKMRYTIEELEQSPAVDDFVRMFRHWLERTGRLEQSGEPE